jgi:iron(III) transport system ATP-binding protein
MVDVSLSGITKRFGSVVAADEVTLMIPRGELFFLLGPSGCGKTTVLRVIAGFERPDRGTVRFDHRVMNDVPPHRRNTGMVFQNYALWPHLSVEDNVAYGLAVRHMPRRERRRRVGAALEMVRMAGFEGRLPAQLSGGQQQRVALARALVIQPDVVLLDEPLSNLDAKLRLEMRAEIMRIHQAAGTTTIYVTHDQKEALSVAERLAVIRDGRIEQVGSPREVYRQPVDEFVATFVGEANTLVGTVSEAVAGLIRVETPLGVIGATGHGAVGVTVALCVRPEACTVSRDRSEGATNCVGARLLRRTYLGEVEQYDLLVGEDLPWKATMLNPRESLEPGDTPVYVTFAPEDVMVFPR